MFIVEFQNSDNIRREIGRTDSESGIGKIIRKFLVKNNYKSPYTRTWINENGERVYDVGSWSEFFFAREEH